MRPGDLRRTLALVERREETPRRRLTEPDAPPIDPSHHRDPKPPARRRLGRTGIRLSAVVALALAAAFVAWFFLKDDDNSTPGSGPTAQAGGSAPGTGPVAVSQAGLKTLEDALGHPIYWAGPLAGRTYEVTQKRDGTIYVRYLPSGVKVGDPRANFLIVVTYPYPNALQALERVQNGRGIRIPGGGLALVEQAYPKSVHMAFPDVDYQIEVFHPKPRVALRVATSDQISPVG